MMLLMENSQLSQHVEHWFSQNARDFPWRKFDTPWGRLVSEYMAQQTQIDRVAKRWPELMEKFPTPLDMAQSDEQDVLLLWQGLGYYRRAKHLKSTANMIVEEFDGVVPSSVDALLKLPGVGKYTAGAIASIAFNKPAPIVDGNVHRVLCRVHDYKEDAIPSNWTWSKATELVESSFSPKDCNEGLMELGATVCTPRNPKCEECPLQSDCLAFKNGTQSVVPPSKPATKKEKHFHYSVVLSNGKKIAFEQRSHKGLWAGMWQVPTVESKNPKTVKEVATTLGIESKLTLVDSFKHVLTHRVIEFQVFHCNSITLGNYMWFSEDEIKQIPLANAQKKVLATM